MLYKNYVRFRNALESWSREREIIILGNNSNPRLPIVSFMIEHLESVRYFCFYALDLVVIMYIGF